MYRYSLLNVAFLCLVNLLFFVVGIFLNAVVVICIYKSTQLRKKSSYFMIFILSCSDLLVVITVHPSTIFLSVNCSFGDSCIFLDHYDTIAYATVVAFGFTMPVLFTMTVERYFGLVFPFLHKTSVTKRRLIYFLVIMEILSITVEALSFIFKTNFVESVMISSVLVLLILMNYRMYTIAKSKSKRTSRNGGTIPDCKKYYTCLLAVASFFVTCSPSVVYYVLKVTKTMDARSELGVWLFFWSETLLCTNSSVNSLIFFWNNSILRNEAKRLLTAACFCFRRNETVQ